MLETVEWGEFRFNQIFNHIEQGRRLKKDDQKPGNIPFVMAGVTNTGVVNYVSNPVAIFPANSITVDIFGNTFYRNYVFGAGDDTGVYWNDEIEYSQKVMIFFTSVISKTLLGKYSYGSKLRSSQSLDFKIKLPINNSDLDLDFMEKFVSELEARHSAELEARHSAELENYLSAAGLKDYQLTAEEEKALADFEKQEWVEFLMGDLFDRVKTNKLPYKAKDLPKEPGDEYILPALTSSFINQGLNYYVPKGGATILKNVISIPSNSDVYRAYFQSRDFTVLSDAYAIKWSDSDKHLNPDEYLFIVPCINEVTDLSIYSYKNKLGGWNVVKNKSIMLPINEKKEINFEYMRTFVKAIKKLAIKDVVLYADAKIAATKTVTGQA